MDLALTADQELLRATTRAFLERESPVSRVRELINDAAGFDATAWKQGADLGWFSLLVAPEHGGGSVSDDGAVDLSVLAVELGRLLFPGPVLETNLVAHAISRWGSPDQQARWLGPIVSGDVIATWAFAEPNDRWDVAGVGLAAVREGGDYRLHGVKSVVRHAALADVLLVVANTGSDTVQLIVPTSTDGVIVEPLESFDLTRRFATVRFDGALVSGDPLEGGADAVERLLEFAAVMQCAETVGALDRIFELTREYALNRFAFGRSIASFQAIKHGLAEMLGWIESSKAGTAAAAAEAQRGGAAATELACAAKAYIGTHAPLVARSCLQTHGGIGYTWEHDLHLYLRRIESDRSLYGSPEQHLDRLATLIDI
jgi:alkylation response protein AidB-like acyl-CoA dehydrogenase